MSSPMTPPGWAEVHSALPGIRIWEPPPAAERGPADLRCPGCGGPLAFDPAQGALACTFCGFVSEDEGTEAPEGQALTRDAILEASRPWQLGDQTLHCDGCGADLAVETGQLSRTCSFCGSAAVLLRPDGVLGLRPTALAPFAVGPDSARAAVDRHLQGFWVASGGGADGLVGLYIPVWLLSTDGVIRWRARVGTPARVTGPDGRPRDRLAWADRHGRLALREDRHLTSGTDRIPQAALSRMAPRFLAALEAFRPEPLAGWPTLASEIDLVEARRRAQLRMRSDARDRARAAIRSEHVRGLTVEVDFQARRWQYALVPVYVAAGREGSEVAGLVVDGVSGTVWGPRPVAWGRVRAALLALVLPGFLLLVAGLALAVVGIGLLLLPIGGAALAGGAWLGWRLLKRVWDIEDGVVAGSSP